MNFKDEVMTESNMKFEPLTLEDMKKTYAVLDGIKVVEDKNMPENMLIMVNGKKEIKLMIDLANEKTKLQKEIADKDKKIKGLEATVKQYSEYLD